MTPASTATVYTNKVGATLMNSPYSPQNITLEKLGVKQVGFFVEASVLVKRDLNAVAVNGNYIGGSSELKLTGAFQILDNGSELIL